MIFITLIVMVLVGLAVAATAVDLVNDAKARQHAIGIIAGKHDPDIDALSNVAMIQGLDVAQATQARGKIVEIVATLPLEVRRRIFKRLKQGSDEDQRRYVETLLGA